MRLRAFARVCVCVRARLCVRVRVRVRARVHTRVHTRVHARVHARGRGARVNGQRVCVGAAQPIIAQPQRVMYGPKKP